MALHGTIGGGELEFQAIELARGMLPRRRGPRDEAVRARRGPRPVLRRRRQSAPERVPQGAPWVGVAARWHDAGVPCMVVTPFDGEARLLVQAGETWGSLGDAALDARAARPRAPARERRARDGAGHPRRGPDRALRAAAAVRLQRRPLRRAVTWAARSSRVLGPVPCRVTWVDSRRRRVPGRRAGQRAGRPDRRAGGRGRRRRARAATS